MDLFDKDEVSDSERKDTFKINENFKSKYEHNERRRLLDQGKLKYGDLLKGDESEDDESESSSEDSQGDLINEKVERKFMETLVAIRQKDKKVIEKAKEEALFKDEDFLETA